ncbi:acyl-CoA dehydrogenase family protein [Streptomyces sp. NPDC088748]|uniref:acyl-CoA dehydrogenase family protein n=1 Tax=Streptomyces sp. NPDC088748 TaxID=3365887 RepID=UPI00383015F6
MNARDDHVERMEALLPLLREHASAAEAQRRIPQEVVTALEQADLFRLAIPAERGGEAVEARTLINVLAKAGEGDGATAWVLTLVNIFNWMASLFSTQAQEEVFADPSARVVGVLAPTSTAIRTDGGWRLTGRWGYNSGSWQATWAILEAPLKDSEGNTSDHVAMLVPRDDYSIEDTWYAAGMRGTASNAVVVEDAFVPDHRVLSLTKAVEGAYATDATHAILSRAAFVPLASLVLAAPLIGIGRAALQYVLDHAGHKPVSLTFYDRQSDSTGFQLLIAEAANRIDTAYLHATRAAADIDDYASRGEYPPMLLRARVRSDTGVAVQNVLAALHVLLDAHGAAAFAESCPLQRMWRDANTAGRHAVAVPHVNFEVYGRELLGVPQITPLI